MWKNEKPIRDYACIGSVMLASFGIVARISKINSDTPREKIGQSKCFKLLLLKIAAFFSTS